MEARQGSFGLALYLVPERRGALARRKDNPDAATAVFLLGLGGIAAGVAWYMGKKQGGGTPPGGCQAQACPSGQHWDGQQCGCVSDPVGGCQVQGCPSGQHWDAGQCRCVSDGGGSPPPSGGTGFGGPQGNSSSLPTWEQLLWAFYNGYKGEGLRENPGNIAYDDFRYACYVQNWIPAAQKPYACYWPGAVINLQAWSWDTPSPRPTKGTPRTFAGMFAYAVQKGWITPGGPWSDPPGATQNNGALVHAMWATWRYFLFSSPPNCGGAVKSVAPATRLKYWFSEASWWATFLPPPDRPQYLPWTVDSFKSWAQDVIMGDPHWAGADVNKRISSLIVPDPGILAAIDMCTHDTVAYYGVDRWGYD